MSSDQTRSGAPQSATITTAGTPGSSDQVRTFTPYARPAYVTNMHATDDLYVKINEEGAADDDFVISVSAGQAVEITSRGIVNVTKVSLYYASAAYSNAKVTGWTP